VKVTDFRLCPESSVTFRNSRSQSPEYAVIDVLHPAQQRLAREINPKVLSIRAL
jgi:hypothetical protein